MPAIGFDRLYYSKITEDLNGDETYGTPLSMSKGMTAALEIETNEATLFADDSAAEVVKEFKNGKLTLGISDIGAAVACDLIGVVIDDNGVGISQSEGMAPPVAVGFRAKLSNGKYRYYWIYRVIFGIPSTNLQTKGDTITFSTPTIEGMIVRRNKLDGQGKHPWKAEVDEGDVNVPAETITGWYTAVYEPTFAAPVE